MNAVSHHTSARSETAWWFPLFTTVIPSAVIPVGCALLFNVYMESWRLAHEPFHALIEGVGSFAAILLALIILSMRRSEMLRPSYIWVATTLMGMGLLDGFHAGLHPGTAFVWLHSLATFVGGLTFALVILPEKFSNRPALHSLPLIVAITSILLGIGSLVWPELIPIMVEKGKFTVAAEFLNITGGVGFMIAWAFFAWSHRFDKNTEERLLLANHCLLFGTAGLLFHFSALWDATWWLWHILRLLAYLVILGFFVDIYLKNVQLIRNNQQKLALTAGRLETVLDNVADGIITIDVTGKIESFNAAAEHIFGYHATEVLGENVSILMPDDVANAHDGFIRHFLNKGSAKPVGKLRELSGMRKNGKIFPLEVALSQMEVNKKIIFSGIVRDITERQRMDTMKKEFISTVSHELRTPLTSIRGSLNLMQGGAVGKLPEAANEMLEIASNNTERLLLLINDILDIQKIESGKMLFRFEATDLKPFIQQAIQENQAYADQFNVKLVFKNGVDDLRVFADKDRLMQVMANLISNAAKFSPSGDQVELSFARHNNHVRISVTDHGDGIPEDFQPLLFEKFTQLDSTDTRQKGGTGLGLSITRLIVEKHGGLINLISKQGVGTTFYVDIPLLFGSSNPGTEPGALINRHHPCILIVEDDHDVAALLQRMLAEAGYNSDVAYSASQARTLLEARGDTYRVMTLDIQLPDEDGLEMLAKLRSDARTLDLPVVVVSAKTDEARRQIHGGAIGVVDWLDKPIDQNRLIASIKMATGNGQVPRVLHVEDDKDVHQIVSTMVRNECELVWTTTLEASKEALQSEEYNLVLLDIGLPDGSGLDLLDLIEQRVTPPRVVIFSAQDVDDEISNRVSSVLVKSQTTTEALMETIIRAMRDQK